VSNKTIILAAALGTVLILAMGAAALGAGQASRTHISQTIAQPAGSCWNPEFTGGFSWSDGSRRGHGWHTAHMPDQPCSAVQLEGDCGCSWCTEVAQSNDTGWLAHSDGCSCGWCASYRAGPPHMASHTGHPGQCGCGWCYGHSAFTDGTGSIAHQHHDGCCCGWCRTADLPEGNDKGNATKPMGHGCCSGCC